MDYSNKINARGYWTGRRPVDGWISLTISIADPNGPSRFECDHGAKVIYSKSCFPRKTQLVSKLMEA